MAARVGKCVLRPALLVLAGGWAATSWAGQLLDERVAPAVAAPAPVESVAGSPDGEAMSALSALTKNDSAAASKPGLRQFVLRRDQRLSEQLKEWLEPLGWILRWELSTDWVIPADVYLETEDVLDAVDQLAQWMSRQGAPVQFVAFERNKILDARSLQVQMRQ